MSIVRHRTRFCDNIYGRYGTVFRNVVKIRKLAHTLSRVDIRHYDPLHIHSWPKQQTPPTVGTAHKLESSAVAVAAVVEVRIFASTAAEIVISKWCTSNCTVLSIFSQEDFQKRSPNNDLRKRIDKRHTSEYTEHISY